MLISNSKKINKALRGEKIQNLNPEDRALLDLGKKLSQTRLVSSDDIHIDAFFSETLKEKLYYDWARNKQNAPLKKNVPILKYATSFAFTVASLILMFYFGMLYVNAPDSPARVVNLTDTPNLENLVQPINAQLTYVSGRVEVWENGQWVTAPSGLIISADRQIRTTSEARAILEFGDGSALRLDHDTHVIIERSDTRNIIIQQIIGKSYSRVNKSSALTYLVRSLNTETTALGTAFTIEIDNFEKVKVKVLESAVKISLIREDVIKEEEVNAGQEVLVDTNKPAEESTFVQKIDQSALQSDFFAWNREEDRIKNQPLGELEDISPPFLLITHPANGTLMETETVHLVGKTEKSASILINGQISDNRDGAFEKDINLNIGDNIVEVVSTDDVGNATYAAILIKRVEVNESIKDPVNIPVINKPATPTIEETDNANGTIELYSVPKKNGTYLTWVTKGIDAPYGYMIMVDDKPEIQYPSDYNYHFPYSYGRHYFQTINEPGTYYLRICEYEKNGSCGIYSNVVTVEK